MRIKISLFFISFLMIVSTVFSQQPDTLLEGLMRSRPEKFDTLLKNSKELSIQIIYTQVNRDKKNNPTLTNYTYHLDPKDYFYPASLVKLPVSALALEKINKLKKFGYTKLDKNSRLEIDSSYKCQRSVKQDTSAGNKYPSIAHYIKKMLLVSDNDAYSRMYEFLGQEYINTSLWNKGYTTARVIHRFAAKCDTNANRHTNPFTFFDENGEVIYKQPEKYNPVQLKNYLENVKKGSYKKDNRGKLIAEPKDFSFSNYLCLQDIHDVLTSLILPKGVPEKKRFELQPEDYKFLQQYMSMYPRESIHPVYSPKKGYNDSYKKYLIYGTFADTIKTKNVRIFNIVGLSYGYAIDCAYIVDFDQKIEYFVSAVIYANKDNILNGKYQYNSVAMPFMVNLGQLLYEFEKNRKKEHLPNLDEFKFDYTKE